MAITPTAMLELGTDVLSYDAVADNSVENDVAGGPCTLHAIHIHSADDNSVVYLKLYDAIAPTVGTIVPDEIVMVERGSGGSPLNAGRHFCAINPPDGLKFENGLSFACVEEAGTAGTTSPSQTVKVGLEVTRSKVWP